MKFRAEMLRDEKIIQIKGLSMGKARATMGLNRGQERSKNKQEKSIFRNAHFSRREFLL